MRKITADCIFTGKNGILRDKVIILNSDGRILSVDSISNHDPASIERFEGTLIPGFVNTHCHLELSHLKGLIPTGTGLIPFISKVVKFREFPEEEILDAIEQADEEMSKNGIVAVGDICNKPDTKEVKDKSKISYYSFIEFFDFLQEHLTDHFFSQFNSALVSQTDSGLNKKCAVPHSPYSVSPSLFSKIQKTNSGNQTISIHNQECHDENEFFLSKRGRLVDFYKEMGMNLEDFQAIGKNSIYRALESLNPNQKTLFVHNTVSTKEDVAAALKWSDHCFWATCPNANLYIENKLPDYRMFMDINAKMTIGTDSLSSNWQLDIWEEIKTIKKFNSYLPLKVLIQWATINGAEALGYHHIYGSLEPGKSPGVNLIDHILEEKEEHIDGINTTKLL